MRARFGKKFGRDHPEDILAGEFLLCQGLRFAIDVKHPFRALRGAIMELSTLPDIEARHPPAHIFQNTPLTLTCNSPHASPPPNTAPAKSSASARS